MFLYPLPSIHFARFKDGSFFFQEYTASILIKSGIVCHVGGRYRDSKGLRRYIMKPGNGMFPKISFPVIRNSIIYQIFTDNELSIRSWNNYHNEFYGMEEGVYCIESEFYSRAEKFFRKSKNELFSIFKKEYFKTLRESNIRPDNKIETSVSAYAKYKLIRNEDAPIFFNDLEESLKERFRVMYNDL